MGRLADMEVILYKEISGAGYTYGVTRLRNVIYCSFVRFGKSNPSVHMF